MSGCGIGDKEDLVRLDDLLHVGQLIHQSIIDVKTSGRIEDDHLVVLTDRLFGRLARILAIKGKDIHARLLTQSLELLDSSGALQVTGNE